MTRACSLHIGLNFVDPNAYGGWDGQLAGCINDANDMQALCQNLGLETQKLIDAEANSLAVVRAIGQTAQALQPGDLFVLTYSGHGGQVPDTNGDESDGQDETWVLWDRMLIDDELASLWSQFRAGVRIFMVSDSCHSGTVARMVGFDHMCQEATAMHGARAPRTTARGRSIAAQTPRRFRLMPTRVNDEVVRRDASAYETLEWVAGSRERAEIGASVLLISGCQDHQLSADGARNGLFTETLLRTWAQGGFQGTYAQFHRQIVQQMPPNQTPNLYLVGAKHPGFEAQRPFTPAAPAGTAAQPGTPTPIQPPEPLPGGGGSSGARLTLRRGDRGPQVLELQQDLAQLGHLIGTDGIFGAGTEREVRAFQQDEGLSVDGVVGQATWAALDRALAGGTLVPQPTQPQPGSGSGSGAQPTPGPSGNNGSGASGSRPTLRRGSKGADVEFLQQCLVQLGCFLTPDGDFGQRTESAVRSFQASNGLSADGVVGQQTWNALALRTGRREAQPV